MNITRYNDLDFADMTQEMINEICTTFVPPREPQHCNRCGCITPNGGMCKECLNLARAEQNEIDTEREIYKRTLKNMGKCSHCGKTRVLRNGVCEVCMFEISEEKNRVAMREKYRKTKEYMTNYVKKNKEKIKEYSRKWAKDNYSNNAEEIKEHYKLERKLKCQPLQTA
jgi:hypothetical protein